MSIFSFDFQHEKMPHWVQWYVIFIYIQIFYVSLPNLVAAVIQPQNGKLNTEYFDHLHVVISKE